MRNNKSNFSEKLPVRGSQRARKNNQATQDGSAMSTGKWVRPISKEGVV